MFATAPSPRPPAPVLDPTLTSCKTMRWSSPPEYSHWIGQQSRGMELGPPENPETKLLSSRPWHETGKTPPRSGFQCPPRRCDRSRWTKPVTVHLATDTVSVRRSSGVDTTHKVQAHREFALPSVNDPALPSQWSPSDSGRPIQLLVIRCLFLHDRTDSYFRGAT
jgi:hypothetical protein